MAKFIINGEIVSKDIYKESKEDVTPAEISEFINSLEKDEPIEIDINSLGGDVFAGVAISNMIRKASANGHRSKAHVMSIAASIASVIACSCDELEMDDNSFIMIHLPWCSTCGNAIDLANEIKQLDQCKKALISVYRSKFDLSDEELEQMMVAETWIDASSVVTYKLDCKVIESGEPLKIAASIAKKNFNNKPIIIRDFIMNNKEEKEVVEETTVEETVKPEETEETVETVETVEEEKEEKAETEEEDKPCDEAETVEEETVEETEEVDKDKVIEELKKRIEELETELETLKKEEVPTEDIDKRVSGMQSKMAKKIDALNKDYSAKIQDFKNQLEVKDKELAKITSEATSLRNSLEDAAKELSHMTSALADKEEALATLNASVNTPSANSSNDWRKLEGKKFFDYMKKNNNILTIKTK